MRISLMLLVAVASFAEPMTKPKYGADNRLMRPEGWRRWMFVGANYGMGYSAGETLDKVKAKPSTFHNIYIQPAAYEQFAKTGEFPDKTMLVMEVVRPGTHASINKSGMFQAEQVGIEVALKDSSRFPEKWAYFNFIGPGGWALADAKAQPKDSCWSCHNQHGAKDNVFAQFYPVLREARPEVGEPLKTVTSAHE